MKLVDSLFRKLLGSRPAPAQLGSSPDIENHSELATTQGVASPQAAEAREYRHFELRWTGDGDEKPILFYP